MKRFSYFSAVLAFCSLVPLSTLAATPEEAYLAARDKAIARVKAATGDAGAKLEKTLLADLEKQLIPLVGPVSLGGLPYKDLPAKGKIALETLYPELGYGMLDGLSFRSEDGNRSLLVTTESLLTAWLKGHAKWWEGQQNPPQNPDAAVRTESFYTQAVSTDAAMLLYGEVPVQKPAKASFAYAALATASQDSSPPAPDMMIVVVRQDGRFLLLKAALQTKVAPIPSCDAAKKNIDRKADAALAAYNASGLKNQAKFDDYTRLQGEANTALQACFAKNLEAAPFFSGVRGEAQKLVDALSGG